MSPTRLSLTEVETPVALVDLDRARANAERVAAYCRRHGLAWRPHVKTHKSPRVARLQLEAGARGLTVATPREAEVMAGVSDDLLMAYPPVGDAKLERLLALPDRVRLGVALDSVEVAEPLGARARAVGRAVDVLVEVDVGLRRVGVQGTEAVVALAGFVAAMEGVHYRGLLFYAGHIRGRPHEQEAGLVRLGEDLDVLVRELTRAGLAPDVVSGGTTPTLWRSHLVPHLTEVRAGTCIYNDRDAVSVEAAGMGDVAYTVLATVVSVAVRGRAAVDAGSKALSREARSGDGGFGVLFDRPEVGVVALSEEHGMLDLSRTSWRPCVGERVRIVPNHVCVSVNLQDRAVALEADQPVGTLELAARGRGPYPGAHGPPATTSHEEPN